MNMDTNRIKELKTMIKKQNPNTRNEVEMKAAEHE